MFALARGLKGKIDLLTDVAEEELDILALNFVEVISGDLRRRCVECVDYPMIADAKPVTI